jgi:RNA polymerase sigma factor (sigma-70 family)
VFYRVGHDTHLTEDIVAETVLALVSAAATEAPIENPIAWMRTVALRRIQDHFRAAARVQHLIQLAQQQVIDSDGQDPAIQHDQHLHRQHVREAMDELPDTYRLALEWKYVDRLSVKVIAERLDTSKKSVESILFRARRALRSQLQFKPSNSPRCKDESLETSAETPRRRSTGVALAAEPPPDRSSPMSSEKSPPRDTDEPSMHHGSSMFVASRFVRES